MNQKTFTDNKGNTWTQNSPTEEFLWTRAYSDYAFFLEKGAVERLLGPLTETKVRQKSYE